jgi:uncharacterized protein YktA (UPF0223 family)
MSDPASIPAVVEPVTPPHHPHVPHHKDHIDWEPLFNQIDEHRDHNISAVAALYKGVDRATLSRRYHQYKEAVKAGNRIEVNKAIGLTDGRSYSRAVLGPAGDYKAGQIIKKMKSDNQIVTRDTILKEVTNIYHQVHPHFTRNTPPLPTSKSFLQRFQHRNGLSAGSKHKLKRGRDMSEEEEKEKIDNMVEYYLVMDEAVQQYGKQLVMNADETSAHAVQHPTTSWGVKGEPNNVRTNMSVKDCITTVPAVAADGSKLPLFVLVKGKTKKSVQNKHLPSHIYTDHSLSGWSTSETMVRYIHEVVAKYTHDQPSALILDDYDAHKTSEVRAACEEHHMQLILVPPGETATAQPLDVSVMGEIKERARKKWVEDKQQRPQEADTLKRAAERVSEAFEDTSSSNIESSFIKANPVLKEGDA